jgi:cytochrome b subunit of formate dehydrogenase
MQHNPEVAPKYYFRFDLFNRLLHVVLMTTFLGLAATGLPLKFSWAPWAGRLAAAIGGFDAILFFHKFCGVLMTACFLTHVGRILYAVIVQRDSGVLWGRTSMVPQPKDIVDLTRHFRWFFGLGPKPRFDRFTYWEKFDYFAVFWGMAIIGTSGYMLWFSGFFARFLSGYTFNIALVIHSEEALLAVWFIFTIHFFNSHLRPEKFPMDPVIFTGRVSEQELREERPEEWERYLARGGLAAIEADPPYLWLRNLGRIVGLCAVVAGFTLFVLTVMAFF